MTLNFSGMNGLGGGEEEEGIRLGSLQGLQKVFTQCLYTEFGTIPMLRAPRELTKILLPAILSMPV